jgi:hypothetical protein
VETFNITSGDETRGPTDRHNFPSKRSHSALFAMNRINFRKYEGNSFLYHSSTDSLPYLSLGVSLREEATDTLADDWLLSRCASLRRRRYSSPELNGKGVTLSGVWLLVAWALSSTHDSAMSYTSCILGLSSTAKIY